MRLPTHLQRIMTSLNENTIKTFIASRQQVSENTKLAYFYDLRAFLHFLDGQAITQAQLNLFQLALKSFAQSTQQRKVTNINTFLKYLYQTGELTHFYELAPVISLGQNLSTKDTASIKRLEVQHLYHAIQKPGDLIALLILEFGLKPSDIQNLSWSDFNWDYKIVTITSHQLKRILPIRDKFARLARPIQNADDLFSKSRQFLHYELKRTTPLSATALREQYILQRVAENTAIQDLAENLGLKSSQTLEKYYR